MTEPRGTPQQTSTDKHSDTTVFVGVCCDCTNWSLDSNAA